ncbi:hypothetical protein L0245_22755, partial [Salmonella enterica subsp. enterica serovar Paratyphi C]|uniref:hypothetical protein n=1 Tax=Salmonella enterica TaxID=28901 RepID=UPI001F290D8D
SPRQRGYTGQLGYLLVAVYVAPAPAGINRIRSTAARVAVRVPRACGDKPLRTFLFLFVFWCSPRQRG